jgi:hypothetical protein
MADALAHPRDRVEFFVVRDAIINDASFHIVPASTELLARGIQF